MQPARGIAEPPRQGVVGHDTQPDFVGDEDHGARETGRSGDEFRARSLDRLFGAEQVSQPERQAVDQHGRARRRRGMQRLDECQRFLDRLPSVGGALVAVGRDPLRHLGVVGLRGREIDLSAGPPGEPALGKAALAGTRTAEDEEARHDGPPRPSPRAARRASRR